MSREDEVAILPASVVGRQFVTGRPALVAYSFPSFPSLPGSGYSVRRRLRPQAQPSAISSEATITTGSSGLSALAPALAADRKVAWSAAIAWVMSLSSAVYPAARS